MLKNIWIHRTIWIFDAMAFGFIVDMLTGFPLWGISSGVLIMIFGLWKLDNPGILYRTLKLDEDIAGITRIVLLALTFFVECSLIAWLITTRVVV